jgi:hypothetical protein
MLWVYFRNPFLKQALSLFNQRASARHTLDMLDAERSGDPVLEGLYVKLMPVLQTFEAKFITREDGKDISLGATIDFNNKMVDLRKTSRKWEQKIVLVFDVDTSEYKILFPNGRSALYTGKIAERLDRIIGLHNKLLLYPALAQVAEDVELFHSELAALQTAKVLQANGITGVSLELQQAAQTLGITMFSIYGSLVAKYAAMPYILEHFFLTSVLRTKTREEEEEENIYNLSIPVLGRTIAALSYSVDDKFLVSNIGEGTIYCYGAVNANDPAPAAPIEIPSGTDMEITALMLGAPDCKYLIFINNDPVNEGEVEITMI